MKNTEIEFIAGLATSYIGLIILAASVRAVPTPEQLNLTPPPVISVKAERTIASIACEGASNGLPKADLQMNIYIEVMQSARRYSPVEFKTVTDRIVKKSEACNPRNNSQLTAKK